MEGTRPFPRFKRRLTVRYALSGRDWRPGFTRNLSASGLFVEARHLEPPGTKVEMEIDVPRKGTVHLMGEVIWGRSVGRGMERVALGGFGVRVVQADEGWYQFCLALGDPYRG